MLRSLMLPALPQVSLRPSTSEASSHLTPDTQAHPEAGVAMPGKGDHVTHKTNEHLPSMASRDAEDPGDAQHSQGSPQGSRRDTPRDEGSATPEPCDASGKHETMTSTVASTPSTGALVEVPDELASARKLASTLQAALEESRAQVADLKGSLAAEVEGCRLQARKLVSLGCVLARTRTA